MRPFDKMPASWMWTLLLLGVIVVIIQTRFRKLAKRTTQPIHSPTKSQQENPEDAYYNIESLPNFNLATEQPLKIRPFKPKYHLTMALENTTISDLIAMDNTYVSRIQLRASLLRTARDDVLAHRPAAAPPVLEFYTWITATYLPRRFPTVYTLTPNGLFNSVTDTILPLTPDSTAHALALLGENVDCDFMFLLPIPASTSTSASESSPEADGGASTKYRLEAFLTAFPSGFTPRTKLGLSLSEIHGPVPGYASKLQRSMDRFFAALPVGRVVRRVNWGVATTGALHVLEGNHITSEAELRAAMAMAGGDGDGVQIGEAVVRCERQTLHRLPRTGGLVFAFKTYVYPLRELREEGWGKALAEAIEGLGEGSVPGMRVYKREVVWGEKVKRFLRGEID